MSGPLSNVPRDASSAWLDLLRDRLRRPPSRYSVPSSLPILFFGRAARARVATIGLNPSDREYADADDHLLIGPARRFATLDYLRARDREALTDAQCVKAIRWMSSYFERETVYDSYFRTLSRFLDGFGAKFRTGSAIHLDLVQEATTPRWSKLAKVDPQEHASLLATDVEFLARQLDLLEPDVVICTGATVSRVMRARFSIDIAAEGTVEREQWWVGHMDVNGGQRAIAGWNIPLHRATGLTASGLAEFGRIIRRQVFREPATEANPNFLEDAPDYDLPAL